jgi:hypothetical protein
LHADFKTLVLLAAAVAGLAARSDAAIIITVPPGLNPGDTYRLVFVTSTTRDATSSNIADYNSFVSGVAALSVDLSGLGATWTAIGSTATKDAIDNIGSSLSTVGIYRLDGEKIANGTNGTEGLFPLPLALLLNPIYYTEQGGPPTSPDWVWTGTDYYGRATHDPSTSGDALGASSGVPTNGRPGWIDSSWIIGGAADDSTLGHFYAISSEITVGEAVPEPGSIALTALGGAILLFAMRRKRKDPLAMQSDRTPPAHY